MEVITPFESLHDAFKKELEEAEDTISDENSSTSKLVTGLERRYFSSNNFISYCLYLKIPLYSPFMVC